MLCFVLGLLCSKYGVFGRNRCWCRRGFCEIGDIQLPDDDLVQCGSEFCAICNVDTEKCLSVVTEVLGRKNVCFEIFAII